jgi:hypothetical protein
MTLPDERYRAVTYTEAFLLDLTSPKITPKVPKYIRDRARSLLRHYPSKWDMERVSERSPEVFAPRMEELHRFLVAGDEERTN